MVGNFGVFDGIELLAEFNADESADEYRRQVLELDSPEGFRQSAYDEGDLEVHEIPEDYLIWMRLLNALRRSRDEDRVMEQFRQTTEEDRHAAA